MILICDSGSTKADWVLIADKKINAEFQTEGLNPVHLSEASIEAKLRDEKFIAYNSKYVSGVYFFGAGCASTEGKSSMAGALKKVFAGSKISVESDLMAAALATCGNEKGIVSILGTGSNCCYYDGSGIRLKNFGLGYILGDEASGAWFGKNFLKAFLYEQLPSAVHAAFVSEFKLGRQEIIESVYRKAGANLFLSSFMPFIAKHREDSFVKAFLSGGLDEFFETNIADFPEGANAAVHFVGSVAAVLEKEILAAAAKKNRRVGKILKRPMDGLKEYFLAR